MSLFSGYGGLDMGLRMAGNGVVPQQASAAIKALSQRATMDASGLNYLEHIYRKAQ